MGATLILAACDPSDGPSNGNNGNTTPETLRLSFEQTKQFVFDWDAVENATHYVLKENADGQSGFNVIADNLPANETQYQITVPLHQRTKARYQLLACLPEQTECSPVGETQVAVKDVKHLVNSIGFFKGFQPNSDAPGSNNQPLVNNGYAIALSADGTTLAVSDTDQSNTFSHAGAVFVYRRNASGVWHEEQRLQALLPGNVNDDVAFGTSLSLSADGNTLAIGSDSEDNNTSGITQGNDLNTLEYKSDSDSGDSGAVYLFTRSDDGEVHWKTTAYIKDEELKEEANFGTAVSLSADGSNLAVGATRGGTLVSFVGRNGTVNHYRLDDAGWVMVRTLEAPNASIDDAFGTAVSLDSTGTLLAVGAPGENSNLSEVYEANSIPNSETTLSGSGAVYLFKLNASDNEDEDKALHYIKASNAGAGDNFGAALSLSADGLTLAVGSRFENSAATGIINGSNAQPSQINDDDNASRSGAVYLFTRPDADSTWQQHAYLKAPNSEANDDFGASVSLNQNGSQLVVGADEEDSNAQGLEGNMNDNTKEGSGAAYYFQRDIDGNWQRPVYIKASNPASGFGRAVAISDNGETIAVSSTQSHGDTGINGDQTRQDNLSGATYLY
ncbi:hypothetical protein [Saccharospirillum mangrovi]|uniref:hypothetical protein n=1 Tax=Saccharospirillum mangrovi TaxID=2161747 RepID=UPI0013B3EDE2|nr:hypothetical protein [Saccharospirillum mangrovi]